MPAMFDRESAGVLTVGRVGATQSITPEGFLLCEGVKIARTGSMLYAPDEIPDISPGMNSMVVLDRDADVLFDPAAMASFAAKPVTSDHPVQLVTPENWRDSVVGTVLNPRQGIGVEAEYLIADLLIMDAKAIADVQAGLREVSCGYESDREQVKPGVGRTTKIVGNHVALVERGRCGPSCAITDKEPEKMTKRTTWARLRTAFIAKDQAAFDAEVKEAETEEEAKKIEDEEAEAEKSDKEVKDSLKTIADGMANILGRLDRIEQKAIKDAEAEAEAEKKKVEDEEAEAEAKKIADEEAAKKSEDDDDEDGASAQMDSAKLRDRFTDTLSRAELISPGVALPVFDAKAKGKLTVDAICSLRKTALDRAFKNEATRPHIVAVFGTKTPNFDKMPCATAKLLFNAASELARAANNKVRGVNDHQQYNQGPMTAAKMQEINLARRAAKKAQ